MDMVLVFCALISACDIVFSISLPVFSCAVFMLA